MLRLGTPGEGRGARFRPEGDGWIGLDGYYNDEPLAVERDASGRAYAAWCSRRSSSRVRPTTPMPTIPGGIDEAGWH